MTILMILLGLILLLVSAGFYLTMVQQAKPFLPKPLQDDLTMRFVIGGELWERAVPRTLRQKYLISIWFGASGCACLGAALYLRGYLFAAGFAGILAIWSIAHGFSRAKRYRHLP